MTPETGWPSAQDVERLARDPDDVDGAARGERPPSRALSRCWPVVQRPPGPHWLVDYPDAVARHVETIVMESPRSAQRRLTIDVILPNKGIGVPPVRWTR